MGISDMVAFEERLVRKFAVISEAERSGAQPALADEDRPSVSEWLFANGSARHFYGEVHKQGSVLEGLLVDPGEHHTLLPCGVPAPAAFMPQRGAWWSNDSTLAWTLEQTEPSLGLKQQDWNWYRKIGGSAYYPAEWCVQIRPVPNGTHLVVRGLQPGPFDTTNLVGMSFFLRVAWALQNTLHHAPSGPPANEAFPTSFGEHACALLADPRPWLAPTAPVDIGDALRSIWAPLAGGQVTIGELNPKRSKLAHSVLGPAAANEPILGLLGDSGILRAPELVTMTPTHAFIHYRSVRTVIPWTDVVDARPTGKEGNNILLRSRRLGWIPVPGCDRAHAVAEAFRAVAGAVAARNP